MSFILPALNDSRLTPKDKENVIWLIKNEIRYLKEGKVKASERQYLYKVLIMLAPEDAVLSDWRKREAMTDEDLKRFYMLLKDRLKDDLELNISAHESEYLYKIIGYLNPGEALLKKWEAHNMRCNYYITMIGGGNPDFSKDPHHRQSYIKPVLPKKEFEFEIIY